SVDEAGAMAGAEQPHLREPRAHDGAAPSRRRRPLLRAIPEHELLRGPAALRPDGAADPLSGRGARLRPAGAHPPARSAGRRVDAVVRTRNRRAGRPRYTRAMIRGLRTAISPAPDLERGKRFYTAVLGVEPYF